MYEAIRSRRAMRVFTDEPVDHGALEQILRAGRWAPSAGNRRLHKFVVVEDATTIARVRAVSPGMFGVPTALIAICTDSDKLRDEGVSADDTSTMIDVGTTAMCMQLVAHELGLATCPTTSFSAGGVGASLNLPPNLTPDFLLQIGHADPPRPGGSGGGKLGLDDLVFWGSF